MLEGQRPSTDILLVTSIALEKLCFYIWSQNDRLFSWYHKKKFQQQLECHHVNKLYCKMGIWKKNISIFFYLETRLINLEMAHFNIWLKNMCKRKKHVKHVHVKLLPENATTIHEANWMGSEKSTRSNETVCKCWKWVTEHNISVTFSYISVKHYVEMNKESK